MWLINVALYAQYLRLTFLRPGYGALGRNRDFWYPVQLILKDDATNTWRVKWSIGCQFKTSDFAPGSITTMSELDLVDALWLDQAKRRKIKVMRRIKSFVKLELTYMLL